MTIHAHWRRLPIAAFTALLAISSAPATSGRGGSGMTRVDPEIRFAYDPARALINDWSYRSGLNRDSNDYGAALQFARCVKRFDPGAAHRLLQLPIGDQGDRSALVRLAHRNRACVGQISAVSPLLIRAALAESALGDVVRASNRRVTSAGVPELVQGFPLGEIARCQVIYAPAKVTELLATSPGGKKERIAAEYLFSSLPQCGTTTGLGGIQPTAARLAIVDAAYAAR